MLRAIEEDEGEKQILQESESKLKKVVEIILIAIMLGTCCLLVYNLTVSAAGRDQPAST
jgi:hypothetical protein